MRFETPFIWINGRFVKWKEATMHVMTHTLHYGSGVFEGIRCYDTPCGPVLFRLSDHLDRFLFGMKTLSMPHGFSKNVLKKAILALIRKNHVKDCYVRPFAFYGYGNVGVTPKDRKTWVVIVAVPFKNYLPSEKAITVKIPPFHRVNHSATVPGAKISGLYYNAVLSGQWARQRGADEALMLDQKGMIGEGASSNVFGVKKEKNRVTLITPRSPDILEGFTRNTILRIASDFDLKTKIQSISVQEFLKMDEAFFTGTAIEVHPIGKVGSTKIGNGKLGKVTRRLRKYYQQITHGEIPKYRSWLTIIT